LEKGDFFLNKIIRNIFILILIIVFIIAFSSSYLSLSIDNLAYVLAIGIDKGEDNYLDVSFQFSTTTNSTESGSSEKTPTVMDSVSAPSLSTAINLMNSYMGKELNMSHCKIIIFSEELAVEGISEEIYTLINDTQVRPSANIVISKSTAKNYIDKTSPELENLISKYYEIFTNSSKYTGFKPDATIGDFFNSLICNTCEPYAILGGLTTETPVDQENNHIQENYNVKANQTPIEGENGSENIGVAAFKEDKLIGELCAIETVSLLTLKNKVDRFLISIPDPDDSHNYLDIYLTPKESTTITVSTDDSSPYIKVKTGFYGKIYSMSNDSKYLDTEVLDNISKSCNSYLESVFSDYLYKTSKDFKSDINGFGKYALKNFFTTEDFDNYNWLENYKNAFFEVKVDTSIQSGMLITET
jgi:spore germination protein KC